jgi:hypothetical protein
MGRFISRRVGLVVSSCLVVGAMGICPRARADVMIEDSGYALEKNNPGDITRLSWTKVVALFNQYLSNAKQLNVFVGSCNSGGLANAAGGLKTVPYVVSTATKVDQTTTDGWRGTDQNPPGLLAKHDSDDDVVAGSFYKSYTAFFTKQLRTGASTVQQISDLITNNMAAAAVPGTPQLVSGNGGDPAAKINAGASSVGMEFVGNNDGLNAGLPDQPYLALSPLLNSLSYYRFNRNPQTYGKITVNGDGSYNSFITGLTNLQTAINANKGNISTDILLDGHGYVTEKNVTPKPAAIPNAPKQGEEIAPPAPGNPFLMDIGMDPGFWSDLHEGVTQNTPGLFRAEQPDFFLSVSEGDVTGPIGISIDGISLGSFSFSIPSTGGATLDVPLSDSFLSQLFALNPTMPSDIPISFSMASGDSMRLSLADDILDDPTFNQTEYGTGIALDVEGTDGLEPVPEPAGFALILPTLALLGFRRRSAVHVFSQ